MAKKEDMTTEELIAAAQEETETAKTEELISKSETNPGEVELMIERSEKDNSDLHVGVNGKFYAIKRGETIKLPRAVYEVIKNSQVQVMCAEEFMDSVKNVNLGEM